MNKVLSLLLCLLAMKSWSQVSYYQIETADDAEASAYFGKSVAIWGEHMIVGAPNKDGSTIDEGEVYFLKRGSDGYWDHVSSEKPKIHWGRNYLGWSVAMCGKYAIAGAPVNIGSSYVVGRYPHAFIYELTDEGWMRADSLTASDLLEYDDFGESVAINEGWAFLGNDERSKVYVYKRQTDGSWDEVQIISAPAGASAFGAKLDVSGNRLLVGSTTSSKIYNYTYSESTDTWVKGDDLSLGYTMWSMDQLDSILVVGDILDNTDGFGAGIARVYLLGKDGKWTYSESLQSSSAVAGSRFGYSVAIDTNYIAVSFREINKIETYERNSDDTFSAKKTLVTSGDNLEIDMYDEDLVAGSYDLTYSPSPSSSGAIMMLYPGDRDKLPPSVSSFSIFGSPTSSSTSVVFDIVFNEDVTGVSKDDFYAVTETGECTVSVLSVATVSASQYRISTNVGGRGYFSLVLKNADGSIKDLSGNALPDGVNYSYIFRTATLSLPTTPFTVSQTQIINHPLDADQASDVFGYDLDLKDGKAVISAYLYNSGEGAVFEYEKSGSTWSNTSQLNSFLTTVTKTNLGKNVAMMGDMIFAGAPYDTYSSKTSHGGVVNWKNGAENTVIRGANGSTDNYRGESLSARDSLLVFNSRSELVEGVATGAAYVYKINSDGSNSFVTTLTPSYQNAYMGYASAISNNADFIFVGASGSSEKASGAGAVYVYKKDDSGDWVEHQVLYADRILGNNYFGSSVAVSGNLLAVGASGQTLKHYNYSTGAVYVFKLDDDGYWKREAMLVHDKGAAGDSFGSKVELSGSFLLAQASGDDDGGSNSGQAFLFFRHADGSWYEVDDFGAGAANDASGTGLAIDGYDILLGYPNNDTEGSNAGQVRAFKINTTLNVWNGEAWSGGTPASSDAVIFDADYGFAVDEVLEVGEAYFTAGVDFDIENNASLVINGDMHNSANMEFLSGTSLNTSATTTYEGESIDFIRQTTFEDGKYSIVGSPVATASRSALGSIVYEYDVTVSDTTRNSFARFVRLSDQEEELTPAKGYFSAFSGELTFSGTPNVGTISLPLDTGFSKGAAYNLVSNPYPAAISFEDFYTANESLIGGGVIYLWVDGGSDEARRTNSDYLVVSQLDPENPVGGATTSKSWNGYIPSMQGFFVRALTKGDLTFTDDMKENGQNADANYFRKSSHHTRLRIRLSSLDYSANTLIALTDEATSGIDSQFDAYRLSDGFGIYSFVGDYPMIVQATHPLESSIPLGITLPESGEFTIALEDFDQLPSDMRVILLDHISGEKIELSKESYTFSQNAVKQSRRFSLLLQSKTITSAQEIKPVVYGFENRLHIISQESGAVRLYTLGGQLIHQRSVEAGHLEMDINMPGVYIVTLENSRGIHTTKILIK